MLRFLFPISLFLSAVLLFSIQPMIAKALLPVYGGTPAVWTVCMLFFQVVLLVSYGYVGFIGFFNKPVIWRLSHSLLVALSFTALPLLFRPLVIDGAPEWSILFNLVRQLGLPLLIIGASAPLLQFAYSQTKEKNAADPYFLYAASNMGSLLALLLYPLVIERFIGLTYQFHLWSIGYVVYAFLLSLVLYTGRYAPLQHNPQVSYFLPWHDMLYWVFLSFVPCSLMLGVTLYITTDVAATPLFWVLPLALYLLTFVLTFTKKPFISFSWVGNKLGYIFFIIFIISGFILNTAQIRGWQNVLSNVSLFFILALFCHSQLFAKRPKPQLLTLFYFCLALGGVLAGLFNGILAPHWFNQVYEYPLAILLVLFALPGNKLRTSCLIASLLVLFVLMEDQDILIRQRSFYGVKEVVNKQGTHALISQSTVHGLQAMEKTMPNGFSSYYGAVKPVIEAMQQNWSSLPVTIIGLGVGTMVCQFRKEDSIKVIEIDSQVIELAKNPQLFTYLQDCPAPVEIIQNDGRLAVAQLPDHSQSLLVVDAFSSDAIPAHLLTLEAFSLYKKKIVEKGGILVNLSNRHLHLLPVLNAVGWSLDLMVFDVVYKGDPALGQFDAEWAFLTSNQDLAYKLMQGTNWHFVASDKQFLWTDDYSNLVLLLKW